MMAGRSSSGSGGDTDELAATSGYYGYGYDDYEMEGEGEGEDLDEDRGAYFGQLSRYRRHYGYSGRGSATPAAAAAATVTGSRGQSLRGFYPAQGDYDYEGRGRGEEGWYQDEGQHRDDVSPYDQLVSVQREESECCLSCTQSCKPCVFLTGSGQGRSPPFTKNTSGSHDYLSQC